MNLSMLLVLVVCNVTGLFNTLLRKFKLNNIKLPILYESTNKLSAKLHLVGFSIFYGLSPIVLH